MCVVAVNNMQWTNGGVEINYVGYLGVWLGEGRKGPWGGLPVGGSSSLPPPPEKQFVPCHHSGQNMLLLPRNNFPQHS